LGLKKILFMTNNPKKVAGLEGYGLEITDWIPLHVAPNPHNRKYLQTKTDKMGHVPPPAGGSSPTVDTPDSAAEGREPGPPDSGGDTPEPCRDVPPE
ncbi:MAG TPA: hypothetical protein VKT77_12820, partial [Chthonomonadaceae bacterium]|nr:hypothetical protein [Chthonomonadaceae bacterium]